MNISRRLDALRGLDLADLDLRRMGGWPVWVRATCAVLLFLVALAGGYALALNGMVGELERLKEAQQALLREQAEKTSLAALLETLRASIGRRKRTWRTCGCCCRPGPANQAC